MNKFEKLGAILSVGLLSTTVGCSPEHSSITRNHEQTTQDPPTPETLKPVHGYTDVDPQCDKLELSQTGPGVVAVRALFSERAGSEYTVDSVLLNVYGLTADQMERDSNAMPTDIVPIEPDGYLRMELMGDAFVQIEGQLVVEDSNGELGLAPQTDECIIQVSSVPAEEQPGNNTTA